MRKANLPEPQIVAESGYTKTVFMRPLQNDSTKTAQKTTQKTIQKTTQKILNLLRQNPSMTRMQISDAIGLSQEGVKWNLYKLKTSGIIRRAAAPEITGKELETLRLAAEGCTNREIAETLAVSEITVKVRLSGVFAKLGAHDRVDAVNRAVARGLVPPRTGTEYSIRFTIDYRSGRHSVAILDGGTYKTLAATGSAAVAAGTTSFPIAAPGAEKISRIRFDGEGLLRSIAGRYAELEISGFSEDEIVSVNGGVVRLTGGQAEWLNAFGDKTAVADAFAGLSGDEFAKAYLLNLDVMDKNALDDCVFDIAGINVGDEYIEIGILLIRPRAVKEGGVAKAINGTLRIYGASTLEGLLDPALDAREVKLMPDDFGDGKTEATATIEKTGRETFFNAAIE